MKRILIIFSVLMLVNTGFALGSLRVESITELPDNHKNLEVRDADGNYAPVLIVKTKITGLGFRNIGRPTKYAAEYNKKKHQYKFYLNANQRVVELSHEDYSTLEVRLLADFNMDAMQQRVYELVLQGEEIEPQISRFNKGSLSITSEPEGAEVRMAEFPDFQKYTPCSLKRYPAIAYNILISKDGYALVDTILTINENIESDVNISSFADL